MWSKFKKSVVMLGFVLYASFAGMLLFGANGFAYIDPSVMTYVIQAVSGIVIAIGAAGGEVLFDCVGESAQRHIGGAEEPGVEHRGDIRRRVDGRKRLPDGFWFLGRMEMKIELVDHFGSPPFGSSIAQGWGGDNSQQDIGQTAVCVGSHGGERNG